MQDLPSSPNDGRPAHPEPPDLAALGVRSGMGGREDDNASVAEVLCFAADGSGVGSNDPAEAVLSSAALDVALVLSYIEGLMARDDSRTEADSLLHNVLTRAWCATRAGIVLHRKQRRALLAAVKGRQ
jgi:hypothetical protein